MADHEERLPDDWATLIAGWTFKSTIVLAVLFVAAAFIFVLR